MKPFIYFVFLATIIWTRPVAGSEVLVTSTNASRALEKLLPTGSITFTNLENVFSLYAELTSRQIIRQADLPTPMVTFATHKPLTRDEAMTAIQATLALNGISAISLGEKFTKLVPVSIGCGTTSMPISKYSTYVFQLPESIPSNPTNLLARLKPFATDEQYGILIAVKARLLFLRDQPKNIERMIELTKEWCSQSEQN